MKTTIDLPDDLVRAMKIRAIHDNRKLKDLAADLIRFALNPSVREGSSSTHLPKTLPVIRSRSLRAQEAIPSRSPQEMADWIKEADLDLDTEPHEKASGC